MVVELIVARHQLRPFSCADPAKRSKGRFEIDQDPPFYAVVGRGTSLDSSRKDRPVLPPLRPFMEAAGIGSVASFAGATVSGKVAPIPDLPALTPERGGSPITDICTGFLHQPHPLKSAYRCCGTKFLVV
jgi:hypothetical protein